MGRVHFGEIDIIQINIVAVNFNLNIFHQYKLIFAIITYTGHIHTTTAIAINCDTHMVIAAIEIQNPSPFQIF